MRLSIYLTPLIPLSFKGEGEEKEKEGLTPLLNTPKRENENSKATKQYYR